MLGGEAVHLRPKLVSLMVLALLTAALGAGPASGAPSSDLAAVLTVTPDLAVPNQTVVLFGTGFTPAAVPGGAAASGAHQITGTGASVVTVNGDILTFPSVTYPIDFDPLGSWAAPIIVPVTAGTVAGGLIPIKVVDDQGVTLTTQLTIKTPSITLIPASGRPDSSLTITGTGFPSFNPAFNPAKPAGVQVSISYSGTPIALVSPDFFGAVNVTVQVPTNASIASTNLVHALVVGYNQVAAAIHTVPGATITLSPASGRPGSVVTITGVDFPANVPVSNTRAGNITVSGSSEPDTGGSGGFVTFFVMPFFAPGVQTVTATAGGITGAAGFTVLEGPAVTQPVPTPQAPTGAAQALGPLILSDNLIRVWAFDNTGKSWAFFDPRPAFAKANTIRNMTPGRVYWLRLNRDQSALLNGKVSLLYEGWNLVPW